jgi:fucose permease
LEQAVTAMSIFFLAMLIGRATGSWLARQIPTTTLLAGALALALVGVLIFWQAPSTILTLIGLTIAGLGISNLFPLSLSVAVATAPDQPAATSARMTLAGGLAIFCAPMILGGVADQIGLRGAFALVPFLVGTALLVGGLVARVSPPAP